MQISGTCFRHGTSTVGSKHSSILANSNNLNQIKSHASVIRHNGSHERRNRTLPAVTCGKPRPGRGKALLQGKLRAPADDPELLKVEEKFASVEVGAVMHRCCLVQVAFSVSGAWLFFLSATLPRAIFKVYVFLWQLNICIISYCRRCVWFNGTLATLQKLNKN